MNYNNNNNEMPPRSHYHNNYAPRRHNRGRRRGRGGRGRGGYRNYDDNQSQSPSNSGGHGNNNNYARNSYRQNNYRNNRRGGSYRGNGPPPRYNRDRYRNNNYHQNNNYNQNDNNNYNYNNNSNANMNVNNNANLNNNLAMNALNANALNANANLWNQPQMNGMYMNMPMAPFLAAPYPMQPIQPIVPNAANATATTTNATTATNNLQSPRSNTENKEQTEPEGEHKSDTNTTATTTSNSTVPNGHSTTTPATATSNSNTTTPQPAAAAAAVNGALFGAANPYLNSYWVSPMGMMGGFLPAVMTEPPEQMHLQMNQMTVPTAWQDEPDLPVGPYYVLKVACVATGYGADDRSVGHIALLDWNLKGKANVFVKPEKKVISYLEPLTNLSKEWLDKYGYELEKAITIIKSELPKNAVLIGQNINMDLQWLGLKQGVDFRCFIDLRDLWRSWSDTYNTFTHYSLAHQAKCILNYSAAQLQKHSASIDAITEMKLFQYYVWCRYYNMQQFYTKVYALQTTKIEPSFAKKNPVFEGVAMQTKRKYKGVPYITANPQKGGDDEQEKKKQSKTEETEIDATKPEKTDDADNNGDKQEVEDKPETIATAEAVH